MLKKLLTSEKHPSKVEAIFDTDREAQAAREKLMNLPFLKPEEIMLISQNDHNWSKKIEPEIKGIQYTLLKTHFLFGLGGLLLGWIIGWGLTISGIPLVSSNPFLATTMIAFFGLMIGLLFAGLLTLRPDHDIIIKSTRNALSKGKTVLIVHTENHREVEKVEQEFNKMSQEVHKTF